MCNFRRNCGCSRCSGGENGGGGMGHGVNPCAPNPTNQEFSRVVATWQTVRHYRVSSHDTIRPICGNLAGVNFENAVPNGNCGCGGGGGVGGENGVMGGDNVG